MTLTVPPVPPSRVTTFAVAEMGSMPEFKVSDREHSGSVVRAIMTRDNSILETEQRSRDANKNTLDVSADCG